ncbi:MAG: hypothetical protein J6J60_01460 [Clostridia bacterium]|nr:hypothetical protein [Clostridia bacterium]
MEIINLLKDNKVTRFVIGDEINFKLNIENCIKIDDVRSAAFYAFGESKIKNENVVLIVNGEYLPSVYTVLTEAWFQKTNLVVIALYNSIYDVETHYLDRCLVKNIKFIEKDFNQFKDGIEQSLKLIGPKLFNVVSERNEDKYKYNYNNVLEIVDKNLNDNFDVYLYNSDILNNNFKKLKCINIESKYKYGIISKYAAMITENNKKILVCDTNCLKVDSNIFNNRYINNSFKIILINKEENNNYQEWIASNDIKVITCVDLNSHVKEFLKSEVPTVLIVKEEI